MFLISTTMPLTTSCPFNLHSDLQNSMSLSYPIHAKSVKTGKMTKSKTSKATSVDTFSIDTTTDDAPISSDAKSTVSGDVFSYGAKTEKVIAFGKTGKEAKAAVVDSEDDVPSSEASAKSGKIVTKIVRAMPTGGTTGTAANVANAAENVENAAVINVSGSFVVLTFAAVGAMLA